MLHAFAVVAVTAAAGPALIGCKEEGALEQAGEKVDEAVRDGKRSVEDATD
jgi:hypothetical protein